MTKEEFLTAGMKLLGIYFLVSGVIGIGWCFGSIISKPSVLVPPILHFLAAYALLWKTKWCLKHMENISE